MRDNIISSEEKMSLENTVNEHNTIKDKVLRYSSAGLKYAITPGIGFYIGFLDGQGNDSSVKYAFLTIPLVGKIFEEVFIEFGLKNIEQFLENPNNSKLREISHDYIKRIERENPKISYEEIIKSLVEKCYIPATMARIRRKSNIAKTIGIECIATGVGYLVGYTAGKIIV